MADRTPADDSVLTFEVSGRRIPTNFMRNFWLLLGDTGYRVVVDQTKKKITFKDCMLLNKFWTLAPTPSITCSFKDITGLKDFHAEGHQRLDIQTIHGHAAVSDQMDGFLDLRDLLIEVTGKKPKKN